jgi:hypothetical protein
MSDRKLVKQLEEQSRRNREHDPRSRISRRARTPLLKRMYREQRNHSEEQSRRNREHDPRSRISRRARTPLLKRMYREQRNHSEDRIRANELNLAKETANLEVERARENARREQEAREQESDLRQQEFERSMYGQPQAMYERDRDIYGPEENARRAEIDRIQHIHEQALRQQYLENRRRQQLNANTANLPANNLWGHTGNNINTTTPIPANNILAGKKQRRSKKQRGKK